jgi:hypothetical protein
MASLARQQIYLSSRYTSIGTLTIKQTANFDSIFSIATQHNQHRQHIKVAQAAYPASIASTDMIASTASHTT